ncbi:MAG TPA: RNA-binding S4 domain-containing protein [Firmicutes bacterium]|nr:RNA-binding S4 domain-containing protein [Candidatus Fermentithermobacillaceae bacterium]
MRLDKFLKVSRLVKRRTLAQELCDGGHVKRNGRTAKSSTPVEVGDVLELTIGPRRIECRVTKVMETADKKTAGEMYEIISGAPAGLEAES